jgi:hypothetical protein
LWRDAVHAIGPHVHHPDIVRAALTIGTKTIRDRARGRAGSHAKSPDPRRTGLRGSFRRLFEAA